MESLLFRRFCRVAILLFVLVSTNVWSFKAQNMKTVLANSASLPIGKYKLDMSVDGLTGLIEFSEVEYAIYIRRFQEEKNYNAPGVEFLNHSWKVALGTVAGKVYKIALYFESDSKNTVNDVSTDLMKYCQKKFGKPSEQRDTISMWNLFDGNIVVQFGKVESTYMINLFETSRKVRTFLLIQ